MKCENCGALIDASETKCPECGFDLTSKENIENNPSEIANPPELEINNDTSLKDNVVDLNSATDVETYEEKEEVEIDDRMKVENVNFEIPSVKDGEVKSIETDIKENESVIVPESEKKKFKITLKSDKKFSQPIFIAAVVVFFILGILVGKSLFSKNYCATNVNTTKKTKVQTVANGKNNMTNVGNTIFKIPNNYSYDKSLNGLFVYDNTNGIRIYIRKMSGSYENIANAKPSIKASLKEKSLAVNDIKEMKINNNSYVLIEGTANITNYLIGFTSISENQLFYVEIIDESNNIDYDALNVADDIIRNATSTDDVSKLEKVSIKDISELTIKVSDEYHKLVNN